MEYEIRDVENVLKEIYLTGRAPSVILLGKPGIGKTEGVERLAAELARVMKKKFVIYDDTLFEEIMSSPEKYFVLVEFQLTQCEPSDLIGAPRDMNDFLKYKPFGWVWVLNKCAGILFLDEITNVQRLDVQSVMLKILQEKLVGFVPLNENVMVIGAGNRIGESVLANELPEPLLRGKILKIEVAIPSLGSWIEYMNNRFGDDWDKRIAVFLKSFDKYFYMEGKEEGEGAGTYVVKTAPRSWTRLAMISHKVSEFALKLCAEGLIGEAAPLFLSFLKIQMPDIDELEENPKTWNELKTEEKYFALLKMANLSSNEFLRYRKFLKMLSSEDREMLNLMFLLIPEKRRKEIAMLASSQLPELFRGLLESALTVLRMERGEE